MTDLELAEAIAREAGAMLRERFLATEQHGVTSKSGPTDLVSEADLAAERLIRGRLAEARPGDAVLGEEGGIAKGTSGRIWIVDPIDGTVNFLHGHPQWCVSIAVEDEGGALAGVIYDPMRNECWSAEAGGSALLDGEPVRGSVCDELSRALVATGFGYDPLVRERQAAVAAGLLPQVSDIRRGGSAALDLAWAAGGRVDAYYERGVQRWDAAAGLLLCERAGLVKRDLAPDPPAADGLLVAPLAIADALLALVALG